MCGSQDQQSKERNGLFSPEAGGRLSREIELTTDDRRTRIGFNFFSHETQKFGEVKTRSRSLLPKGESERK